MDTKLAVGLVDSLIHTNKIEMSFEVHLACAKNEIKALVDVGALVDPSLVAPPTEEVSETMAKLALAQKEVEGRYPACLVNSDSKGRSLRSSSTLPSLCLKPE